MKLTLRKRHIGYAIGALALAGAAFYITAPYPIAASIPHLPGVGEALHGYMHNSVRNRTFLTTAPAYIDLEDPARIRLGAAHFETGCATCHGSPLKARNPVVLHMQPRPTPIDTVKPLREGEWHYITYHGIKYSGMPAWAGAGRRDEAWSVVAFLQRYEGLDAASYADLALGPAVPVEAGGGARIGFGALTGPAPDIEATCARCHGEDGLGRDGTAPVLAGQSLGYLRAALEGYAHDTRQSGIMEPLAAALPEAERARLARHYAALPGLPVETPGDPAARSRGAELALQGDEDEDIPACEGCHGEKRKPDYPVISGQHPFWIETWLRLWREGTHPALSGAEAEKMHAAARHLSDDDIAALALHYGASEMARAGSR
jgi:cytochrome c553